MFGGMESFILGCKGDQRPLIQCLESFISHGYKKPIAKVLQVRYKLQSSPVDAGKVAL